MCRQATYDEEGEITYTALFENPAFETQIKRVATPKLERSNPFVDIAKGTYYYDPVLWAVNHEPQITNGTSATTFSPDAGCTRAQVVTFLWRAAGMPEPTSTNNPFKDVKVGTYYYKAVLWAVEKNITTGTSTTTFSPEDTCTRGQIVTFLWRYEGKPAPISSGNPFKDVKSGRYYYNAVLWAVGVKVTSGTSTTTFSPEDTCTRAQVVTFLYRDCLYSAKMYKFDESKYEIVLDNCTWIEAQAAAAAKGGKLVTLETEDEYQYILHLIAEKDVSNAFFYLGARRDANGTEYHWTDRNNELYGEPLNAESAWCDSLWEPGDPNYEWNGDPETVVILYYRDDRFEKPLFRWCIYDGWADQLTENRQYA